MNLPKGKFFSRNILVALLSLIYVEIGLPESINPKSALAEDINTELLCYWQTANGRSIDLGILCGSKSNQNQPIVSFTNTQNLTIDKVQITIKDIGKDTEFYVEGLIRNSGNIAETNIKVSYKGYNLIDGSLKPSKTSQVSVENIILQPGQTTIFQDKLENYPPDLLILNSLYSVEEASIPLNICYGSSVEKKELCQRLSPSAIRTLDVYHE